MPPATDRVQARKEQHLIVDLTYSYGSTTNNGNVQSIAYSGGGLSYTQSFSYDSLNRLSTSTETSGGSTSWSQTNGYDQYGNRWIDYGGGSHNLSFSSTTNRITTSGFSYDSAGNLTSDSIHSYSFDAENKIVKVDSTSAFVYDGEGQRVKKLIGENTRFVYGIGGQLLGEFSGSTGAVTKEYVYGVSGLIAAIEPSNGTKYTTSDVLGSPRVITNSSGSVVSRHDYMPFGEELFAGTGGRSTSIGFSASDGIRKQFTGYQRDAETNLDFAQARYYSLAEGRFTSADIFGGRLTNPQTLNLYAYVLNNPLKYVDPTGNQETKQKVEQPKPTKVIDDKGRRQRMTVTITELGPVDDFTIFTSSISGIMSGAGSPSVGPRQGPMPPLDTSPRTHRSSLPHIFPRKIGETFGLTGILAHENNVVGGTLSGFVMHDFVDETTILGESHGGKFFSMDESAGGLMASGGLGGGIIFSNADDNEINSSSDSYLLSVGPLGVEVDTGQNASKEFIYTTSITLGKSVGAGLVHLPTTTNTTYPLEYHAQRLYDWLHDSWIR